MNRITVGACVLVLWGVMVGQGSAEVDQPQKLSYPYTSACNGRCSIGGDAGGDAGGDGEGSVGELPAPGSSSSETTGGGPCCCDQSGFIFDAEATFFRYHSNEGIDEDNEFDFEVSPRITVGYRAPDGLGIRLRWWDYDHDNGDEDPLGVETYNLDLELFEEIAVGCCTSLELSAGIRYNEFREFQEGDDEAHSFSGYGGIIALQSNRELAVGGAAYARLRQAILMEDYNSDGDTLLDVVVGMTEIGFGYESTLLSGCYCVTGYAGIEWQQWHDYLNDEDGHATDVGFAGIVLGISVDY